MTEEWDCIRYASDRELAIAIRLLVGLMPEQPIAGIEFKKATVIVKALKILLKIE
jgi:hypothetical protein